MLPAPKNPSRLSRLFIVPLVVLSLLAGAPRAAAAEKDQSGEKEQRSSPYTILKPPLPGLERVQPAPPPERPSVTEMPATRKKTTRRPAARMRLVQQGRSLYLDVRPTPDRVDLLADGKFLGRPPHAGKGRFDLTPYLPGAAMGRLTVRTYGPGGARSSRTFDVSAHQRALRLPPAAPPGPRGTPLLTPPGITAPPTPGPERVKPAPPPGKPTLTEIPAAPERALPRPAAQMRLVQKGKHLYLDVKPLPDRVDLLVEGKLLGRLPRAEKGRFDLTPYLARATMGRLTVHAYDRSGAHSARAFDVSAHQAALRLSPAAPPEPGRAPLQPAPAAQKPPGTEALLAERGAPEEPVLRYLDRGIRITEPRAGQFHRLRSTISVRMEFTREIDGGRHYTVTLHRRSVPGPGTVMHTGRVRDLPAGGLLPPWTMTDFTLPGMDYYVRAVSEDLVGEGHDFSIGMIREALRVLSPNGGETWGRRTAQEILWRGSEDVVVELLRGGSPIGSISGEPRLDEATRTYRLPWFIPRDQEVGTDYKIRVTLAGGTAHDDSNEAFTIREERIGDTNMLVEAGTGPATRVNVSTRCDSTVCRGGSMTYRLTSETHDLNEEISTESTSSCNRDISFSSSPFPAGDDYVVRVLFGACMGHSDRFAIARVPPSRIRIFSPDTGDRWLLGTRQRIEWDDGTPTLENRRITLMNGYDEVIPITPGAISFDPSSERFFVAWDVPHELPAGRWAADRFAIRIEEGGGGPGASFTAAGEPAFSGFFSIPGEGVVVEQPTGGTTYYRLNFLPVSWRVIGDPGVSRVNVELYNNEGDVHIPVADNHPIGTPLSSVFLDPDRVSTGERYILQLHRPDGSNLAQSEEFRIANPSIRVTSPHGGGLAVRHGRSMTIAWRTENLPPGTGLRGTAQWVTPYGAIPICEDLDLNRGSFVWQVGLSRCPDVPVGPMPGGTIEGGVRRGSGNFIRLRLNALPEVQDESSPFTVE